MKLSIVIPAKNESGAIGDVISSLKQLHPNAELIVVNDGSDDATASEAEQAGAIVVSHPYSKGNGASIKTGARHATGDVLVFMDGDGQHQPKDVAKLLARISKGADLVVGARVDSSSQATVWRALANGLYNKLASLMTGHKIFDLTSGMRAAKADKFRQVIGLLPNGFSYPTTSTMAFYRLGYSVLFEPIEVLKRDEGSKSHVRPLQDGARFLLIIFKVATLYSPLKIFVPLSFGFFVSGLGYYAYTFATAGRFTNFGALLLVTAVLTFLIGLVSEQITTLTYRLNSDDSDNT